MGQVRILGLSGRKSSGKTSLLDGLRRLDDDGGLDCFVGEFSLADHLKRFCVDYLGLYPEQCYGTEAEKNSLTDIRWEDLPFVVLASLRVPDMRAEPYDAASKIQIAIMTDDVKTGRMTAREVMEVFGTNVFRKINPDVWVDKTLKEIERVKADSLSDVIAVIPDVRFPNEVEKILGAGGSVVRLTRNPFPDSRHEAECALDPDRYDWGRFSFVLDNSKMTVAEQTNSLRPYLEEIGVL